MPSISLNLIALALFLPLLADALTRTRAEPLEREDLLIWVALGAFVFAESLLSSDLARATSLHYHGAAFLALTLGYCRGLLTAAAIVVASSASASLGIDLLVNAVLPVWLTCSLVAASRRYLPPNPFVFLLGCGFFGLFAVGCVQLALGVGVDVLLGGGGEGLPPPSERLVWGLLLVSGEATLEGMLITVLVVYVPRAVRLFDDAFYLRARG